MGKIQSFRELRVWQAAMELVVNVYRISAIFPVTENHGLTSQIRRASVSVPSNIAEGFGRHNYKEYIHFLRIANGSLAELETQTEIALRLGFISQDTFTEMLELCVSLRKQLIAQQNALSKSEPRT